MTQWETPPWIKIHENCGGIVRWVEAIDQPGVQWTGDCQQCLADGGVVLEEIIALFDDSDLDTATTLRDRVEAIPAEDLAELEWDDDAHVQENRRRLKDEIIEMAPEAGA